MTREREDLVAARTVMNQVRCELDRFWSGPLRLFSHMDAEIVLAFRERDPSREDTHGLAVARMQAFLVRERYAGGQPATALMPSSAQPRASGSVSVSARPAASSVLSYVTMVRELHAQIKKLESEIRTQVRAHPDGRVLLSLFKSPNRVITRRGVAGRDRRLPRALRIAR